MKIGLFIQRFPGGGAEKYVQQIANRLLQKGKDIVVVTSESDFDDTKYDFRIIRLPSMIKIGEYFVWKGLEDVLKQEQFDIIHTNTYGYYHSDKVAKLKEKYGYKLVMTSHGFTGMDLHKLKKEKIISKTSSLDFLRNLYDEKIGKKTLLSCNHLIALSKYDYNFYRKIGIDESKISTIPSGVDDVFFEPSTSGLELSGKPVFLSVGQLSWIKNHKMIIDAMPSILQKHQNAHLYIIGQDMGELESLQKQSDRLHISGNVSFLGTKNPGEIKDYMHQSTILLHTSYAEGLSTVLLESMASGLPFVTTDAGGNGILAQESGSGLIVGFDDAEGLVSKINEILGDHEKLDSMKKNGVKHSAQYSWSVVFDKILAVYEELT